MTMITRRQFAAGLATLALTGGSRAAFADAALSAEQHTIIDRLLSRQIELANVPGVGCAVATPDGVIYAGAFGQRALAPAAPMTVATRCPLASVSKQFVAVCCYLLQQDGKLSIDAPLAEFVPEYALAREMTLHDVLTMTGGIPRDTEVCEHPIDGRMDERTLVENLNRASLDFKPGEHYAYTNCGYDVAGLVVTRVAGVPYGQFLAERIFRPLGMGATSLLDAQTDGDVAQGFERADDRWVAAPPTAADRIFASGNLISTLADMQRWDRALLQNALLSESSRRTMLTVPVLASGARTNYASGWFVEPSGVFWHGGTLAGYGTTNVLVPATGHSIVILGNTMTSEHWAATELAREIYNAAALGPPLPGYLPLIRTTLPEKPH
jgi:D-alanyl-D-alanine carboxypeptidase